MECKVAYLQMIQGAIDRMSSASAIFKGFTATIVAGLSAFSLNSYTGWLMMVSFIPLLSFMMIDVYYLRLERQYRFLYDKVRDGRQEVNFDMRPPKPKDILKEEPKNNVNILSCLLSKGICLFYVPVFALSVFIIMYKAIH